MSYDSETIQAIVEGAILAAGEPVTLKRLQSLFEEHEMPDEETLLAAIEGVKRSCEGRGFMLKEVASGYRFQVREDLATWINRLWEEKPQKYSRAMLETLALIAYRQPITRGDIEEVRGVAVSSHIIKTLSERDWVKVVGHRDVPGRPSLYATTRQFLDYFNLKSLDELPTLGELRDIDSLNESLEFDVLPEEAKQVLEQASGSEVAVEEMSPTESTEDGDSEEEYESDLAATEPPAVLSETEGDSGEDQPGFSADDDFETESEPLDGENSTESHAVGVQSLFDESAPERAEIDDSNTDNTDDDSADSLFGDDKYVKSSKDSQSPEDSSEKPEGNEARIHE